MTDAHALAPTPSALPATITTLPLDRTPAVVYLARLAPGSRRTMRRALDTVASLLTSGRADALACDWPALRYQHTAALRALLTSPRATRPPRPTSTSPPCAACCASAVGSA
jgi:hypothetical protein